MEATLGPRSAGRQGATGSDREIYVISRGYIDAHGENCLFEAFTEVRHCFAVWWGGAGGFTPPHARGVSKFRPVGGVWDFRDMARTDGTGLTRSGSHGTRSGPAERNRVIHGESWRRPERPSSSGVTLRPGRRGATRIEAFCARCSPPTELGGATRRSRRVTTRSRAAKQEP